MATASATRPCRAESSAIVSVANMVSSMTGLRLSDAGAGRQLFGVYRSAGSRRKVAVAARMVTRRRMLMVPPAAAVAAAVPAVARAARAWPLPSPALEPVRGPVQRGPWIRAPYDTYVRNPLVARNTFLQMAPDAAALPSFAEASRLLPEPFWDGHAAGDRLRGQGVEAGVRQPAAARGGERVRGPLHRPGLQRLRLPLGLLLHDAVRALRRAGVSVRSDARQLLRQAAPRRVHLPRDRAGARRRSVPAVRSVVDGTERAGLGRVGALPQLRRP